ncbi:hypothetical protein FOPE_01683 [Fonsecaea pedrosoi]|nr:hypothetical protein FOPE_01683 [Fonsecaea pedrosoi]
MPTSDPREGKTNLQGADGLIYYLDIGVNKLGLNHDSRSLLVEWEKRYNNAPTAHQSTDLPVAARVNCENLRDTAQNEAWQDRSNGETINV